MAHAITQRMNGFNEMAYIGEKPWHNLGQELTKGAPLEVWAREAGMDWKVQRSKVRFATGPNPDAGQGTWETDDSTHVLFRSDSKAKLGIVSDRYKIVQPIEVLKFFTDVATANGLYIETAGTLHGGRQYWAMANLGEQFALGGVDVIKPRVMLATSADGSMATIAKLVSERIVCANTLAIALGEAGNAIKVKHNTTFRAEDVRIDLGLTHVAWERFTEKAVALASRPVTRKEAALVLVKALGDTSKLMTDIPLKGFNKAMEEQPNVRQMVSILDLFDGKAMGSQAATANGTAWGLVNAATQFFDHDYGRTADARLSSAWFGGNSKVKETVLESALELCQ
jgi:phage/plasmid-like protein (TIGR03299 family)